MAEPKPTGRDTDVEDVGGLGDHPGDISESGALREPRPARGSGETAAMTDDAEARAASTPPDLDRAADAASQLPRVDALDAGDSGAPPRTLDTGGASGPGPGSRHQGGTGGSGVTVAEQRSRGSAVTSGDEQPPGGGPAAGLPGDPQSELDVPPGATER